MLNCLSRRFTVDYARTFDNLCVLLFARLSRIFVDCNGKIRSVCSIGIFFLRQSLFFSRVLASCITQHFARLHYKVQHREMHHKFTDEKNREDTYIFQPTIYYSIIYMFIFVVLSYVTISLWGCGAERGGA
jgi:hypothetical protein